MRGNNILGIIYSNGYDSCLEALTALRTMGSVPFCGRYRLIDFPLSNMVNCGISKVGVLTNNNFRSLMDHVGNGRPWDLARKREGLYILPPFSRSQHLSCDDRLTALHSIRSFLAASKEEYVILTDCNVVCNLDYSALMDYHIAKNADITIAYTRGKLPVLDDLCVLKMDDNKRITAIDIAPKTEKNVDYSTNVILLRKSYLETLIDEAETRNYPSFERNLLQAKVKKFNIFGYPVEGFCRTVSSIQSYYDISMELLSAKNRNDLFCPDRPIYTKIRDDMPVIYRIGGDVKNSLIADGCIIEGEVENSILFRGAKVGKGAIVRNSIIMQGAFIGDEAVLDSVILDKNVTIKPHKTLSGAANYPFCVGKGRVI